MTDQQHAGMVSCAGNKWLKTPALDVLAEDGIRERGLGGGLGTRETGLDARRLGRGTNEAMAKAVAVELVCRLSGATQRSVGWRYGRMTSCAVDKIRARPRDRASSQEAIAIGKLEQEIQQGETGDAK